MLALAPGTAVSFDQIAEELWGGKPIGNARNALQANIVRLRRILRELTAHEADEWVRTTSSGYILNVPGDCVDAHRFVELAQRGSRLVREQPEKAISLLEEALRCWRGPALIDSRDGTRMGLEASRLDERRLSTREDLISAKLAVGQERGLVSDLQLLTTEHPERERFSEQLMLTLYRNGRQSEALHVFHDARKRLASELGVEPGRDLRNLYQAILVQDKILG